LIINSALDANGKAQCVSTFKAKKNTPKRVFFLQETPIYERVSYQQDLIEQSPLTKLRQVQRHTKGEFFLHLDCDHSLKASRHYKDVIKNLLLDTQ